MRRLLNRVICSFERYRRFRVRRVPRYDRFVSMSSGRRSCSRTDEVPAESLLMAMATGGPGRRMPSSKRRRDSTFVFAGKTSDASETKDA